MTSVVRVCALVLLSAGIALPASILAVGLGGDIPDNSDAGFSSGVVIAQNGVITDVTVEILDLSHTWAGDLWATLEHVDLALSVDLFQRVGLAGGGGTGNCCGNSADFSGNYRFNDSFGGNLWTVGGNPIPAGDYFPTTVDGVFDSLMAEFGGQNAAGQWRLTIRDGAGADIGSFGPDPGWRLTLQTKGDTKIPEPSTLLLLASGLLALGALHRRTRQNSPSHQKDLH